MEATIRKICARYGLAGETIRPLPGGQVNQVYLIDDAYVLRIGAREDAAQRLRQESQLLRELSGEMPVPELLAFDEQDGLAYQLQRYVRGRKLHMVWKELRPDEKERITAELAGYLQALHRVAYPDFGRPSADAPHAASWMEYFTRRFENILAEIRALGIPIPADLLDMATGYFEQNRSALQAGTPTRLHGDLWLGNILVDAGRITALLDFEYALQAPPDYELLKIEDFCLYPNDYAEEEDEVYCAADFADFFNLLRKYDPGLFEMPRLRERVDLYHLESTFHDYLAWRKDNRATIPLESSQAMTIVQARITNYVFRNGARMF